MDRNMRVIKQNLWYKYESYFVCGLQSHFYTNLTFNIVKFYLKLLSP